MVHTMKRPVLGAQPEDRPEIKKSVERLPDTKYPTIHQHRDQGSQLDLALFYARHGFAVFPISQTSKRPLNVNGFQHGFKTATTDEPAILAAWRCQPDALVGLPTGPVNGFWVIDFDPPHGETSLAALCAMLGFAGPHDFCNFIVRTPSGGLHLYFKLRPGDDPRSRNSDIGKNGDTKARGGYILAPGNVRPDGRRYEVIYCGAHGDIRDARPALDDLVFLATFNKRDRKLIGLTPQLSAAIWAAQPVEWLPIMEGHQKAERERAAERIRHTLPPDAEGMRRQALADLHDGASTLAEMTDGRRNELFRVACRLAKYAANDVLSEAEILAALEDACAANGALGAHGRRFVEQTVRSALVRGQNDDLPPLARRFREWAS